MTEADTDTDERVLMLVFKDADNITNWVMLDQTRLPYPHGVDEELSIEHLHYELSNTLQERRENDSTFTFLTGDGDVYTIPARSVLMLMLAKPPEPLQSDVQVEAPESTEQETLPGIDEFAGLRFGGSQRTPG